MSGGYRTPAGDGIDALFQKLRDMQAEIKEIGRPDGSQTAKALQTLRDLVDGLLTQANGIFSGYVTAGTTISAGGNVSGGGTGSFTAGLTSTGAASTDLAGLSGLRQTVWQIYTGGNAGRYGYASSSITQKTNLTEVPFTAAAFLECSAYLYEYRAQVAIRDDPEHPDHDPEYQVPTEVGFMAEHLIERGLEQFVAMRDGEPIGIDYAAFGAVGMNVVGRELEGRLTALETRLYGSRYRATTAAEEREA